MPPPPPTVPDRAASPAAAARGTDARRRAAAWHAARLRRSPGDAALRHATAEALIEAGDPAAALAVLSPAPATAGALVLAGIAQHDLGALDTALGLFRRAAALAPRDPAPWSNIGLVLKIQGDFDAALAAYDAAIALRPADPRLRVNRAVALLRAGRMRQAWADYEYRFDLAPPEYPACRLLPDLDRISIAGRTVLVTHEEGFGDTLHFARYLPMLARRGGRVIALMPRALSALIARMPGVAAVLEPGAVPPPYDWHCPMFSLPRAFGTMLDTIPAAIPYLHPDPDLVASWARRLPAPAQGLRVGLAWAGQARPWAEAFTALDARRSLDPARLAPLAAVPGVTPARTTTDQDECGSARARAGIHFVSLQKNPAGCPPLALIDPMPAVTTFDDTAAIVANLDLVISVDTSVVHLAGGLGKPVFLLDRYDNCWRWLSGRTDSPWYPTLRIFRQPRPNDWTAVIGDVTTALARYAQSHRAQLRLPG